jgi:phospholipid transport system substrate-binding protein
MIRQLISYLLPLTLMFAPLASRALTQAPDALVTGVTQDVLSILRHDKALQAGDRKKAMALIEDKIAPHFDFPRMTSLAVGRGWRDADADQRAALTKEFRALLVRTYAKALTAYRDQTVSFKPMSGASGQGDVTVRSEIHQPGATPISLDYRLAQGDGGWKVFDVVVDNVSLVTTYRGSFAAELANGGPDALIKALRKRNAQIAGERAGTG